MAGQRSILQEDIHFRILRLLQENPEWSQRELASAVGISNGSAHYVLNALVESLGHIPHVMVDMAMGGRSTAGLGAHVRHNLEALRARRRWLAAGVVDWALLAKPASKLRQFAPLRQEGK